MLPKDDRIQENQAQLDILRRVQRKIDQALQGQRSPRRGVRMKIEAYGGLATDSSEWNRQGNPALAHENVSPPHYDYLDNELQRARFNISGERHYSIEEADALLQRRFPEDIQLRAALKQRLHMLGLLDDRQRDEKDRAMERRILDGKGDMHAAADTRPHGHKGTLIRDKSGQPAVLRSIP